MQTKIGTGIVHVTGDLDTTFKVKGQGHQAAFTHSSLNASGGCSGKHGNIFGMGNYCYVAVCLAAREGLGTHGGGEGRGISWQLPAYSLFDMSKFRHLIAISA